MIKHILWMSAACVLSACASLGPKPTPNPNPNSGQAGQPSIPPGTQGPQHPSNPNAGSSPWGSRPDGSGTSGYGGGSNGSSPTAPVYSPPATPRPPTGPIAGPKAGTGSGQGYGTHAAIFQTLPGWVQADLAPALAAFTRSCTYWAAKDLSTKINSAHPLYGRLMDWLPACNAAYSASANPKQFFETQFLPVSFTGQSDKTGLLTAYYQPEIFVSPVPTAQMSEPILAVPSQDQTRKQPRANISAASSRVIAFGTPIDVFFMQIQGSGILNFPNGRRVRAAYGANNGYPYTSIGGVLVRRGAMTKDQASKQAIENWMNRSGPKATQELMNENRRYIFFTEQDIVPGEGPMGGMRVPLTGMGSLAVDPIHHPYGSPIWLYGKLPQFAGDYIGAEQGLLVIAQDTGKAIRGAFRGDIYFGSGHEAGEKAGVMKHRGHWTLLLPAALAQQLQSRS